MLRIGFLLIILNIAATVFAQDLFPEQRLTPMQEDFLRMKEVDRIDLLSGREYVMKYQLNGSNPLFRFQVREKGCGAVKMNGVWIDSLELYYDTYKDVLLCVHPEIVVDNQPFMIQLDKSRIEEFVLYFGDYYTYFRKLRFEVGNEYGLTDGFYQILYDNGPCYFKQQKSTHLASSGFMLQEARYVRISDEIYDISKKLDPEIFGLRELDMKTFMKEKSYRKGKLKEYQIQDMLKYYSILLLS